MTAKPRATAKVHPKARKTKAGAKGKTETKTPRKVIDWDGVEREFRAGATARSVGAMFGLSHVMVWKKAKAEGWQQADLMEEVRRATKAKLVNNEVNETVNSQTRIEQVDEAAELRASLIRKHLERFAKMQAIADTLAERLSLVLANEDTAGLPCLGDRESPADLLRKLTVTTATLTEKERQALGIDESEGAKDVDPMSVIFEVVDGSRWSSQAA